MTSSDWVDERRMADPSGNVWGRPRLAQTNLPYDDTILFDGVPTVPSRVVSTEYDCWANDGPA